MSTKIYNGYRLSEDVDVFELCDRLRVVAGAVRDTLDLKILDSYMPKAGEEGLNEKQRRWKALEDWREIMTLAGEGTRLYDPYQFDVTFIKDEYSGRIFALLYCTSGELEKVWEAQPEVSYYGYWNNTDPDEDCSPEEWEERAEIWDRILGCDAPARRGISFELCNGPIENMIDLIIRRDVETAK